MQTLRYGWGMVGQPRFISGFGLALVALAIAPPAAGQDAAKQKPWRLEDAIDAPDWLKISGSVRPRYESLGDTFYAGRTGSDELLSIQTLLKVEAGTGDFALGGELLDSRRIAGNAGGGAAGEVNTLEPVQLYAVWRPKNFLMEGANLDLTAGRFTMDIGSRRLVARANYRNLLQAYDGVRAIWTTKDKLKVTAFHGSPTTRTPSDVPSALDNEASVDRDLGNVKFSGVDLEAPIAYSIVGEFYVLDFNEDDDADAATRNRDFSTVGARLKIAPAKSAFDFDVEYAKQTGSVRATADNSARSDCAKLGVAKNRRSRSPIR